LNEIQHYKWNGNYSFVLINYFYLFHRNRVTTSAPFSPSMEITSRLFAVSHDAKFVFSGGHWDWSLRVYSLFKSKTINSIVRHTDIITCLTLDSTGYILVTGSRDTTCVIWNLSLNDNRNIINITEQDTTSLITPEMTLHGHTAEVTCVCVSSELDLVVSGSLDGTCNIHTIEQGIYIRTLKPTDEAFDPIVNLKLSDERHILVQTENDETHLFLYSINGSLIRTRKFEYRVVDMLLSDQYILLAVNHNSLSESTSASIASRIIIKDLFE
jgi:WD40 repeat protein